jgi:predicted  nucleic acid-binding Zn-ribbon protein
MMSAYNIPAPLRQLMTERDSLKAQMDKLKQDYEMLQDEKQKAIEDFQKRTDELLQRRERIQAEWTQFRDAVEAMKAQYQIPSEEQVPPEDDPSATQ